jgi:hypothetical protein
VHARLSRHAGPQPALQAVTQLLPHGATALVKLHEGGMVAGDIRETRAAEPARGLRHGIEEESRQLKDRTVQQIELLATDSDPTHLAFVGYDDAGATCITWASDRHHILTTRVPG